MIRKRPGEPAFRYFGRMEPYGLIGAYLPSCHWLMS
jgi:hypothetical protein